MAKQSLSWEGNPLYAPGECTRKDTHYPNCVKFRAFETTRISRGSFLAHYDVAGGERPYGIHPGAANTTLLP